MKAVILAGGKGSRLRPVTSLSPKPMAKICNKPCIGHILDLLKRHGITEVAVTMGYKPERLKEYLSGRTDMDITLFYEDEPLGTAGSVKQCASFLDSDFLVISGDCVSDADLTSFMRFHEDKGGIATLLTVNGEDPTSYGLVFSDINGRIRRFDEKPGWERVSGNRINTGIYALKKEILGFIPDGEYDFASQLFPLLLASGRELYAFHLDCYWCDIGNPDALRDCNFRMMKDNSLSFSGTGKARLISPYMIGEGCKIDSSAMIGPYAVIGNNVTVKSGAKLYNCVVGDNVIIENNARIQGTVCDGCHIGADACLDAGTVVGEGCDIGCKSSVERNARIYPNKRIGDKTRVTLSLIYDDRGSGLFSERGIEGDLRGEMTPVFAARLGRAVASAFSGAVVIGYSDEKSYVIAEGIALGASSAGLLPYLALCDTAAAKMQSARDNRPCLYVYRNENRVRIVSFFCGLPLNYVQERKITAAFLADEADNPPYDEIRLPERLTGVTEYADKRLAEIMNPAKFPEKGSGLTAILDEAGEDILVKENGFTFEKEILLALLCRFETEKRLPLPEWAPVYLLDLMGVTALSPTGEDFIEKPYFFDNLYMWGRILHIMDKEKKTLRELTSMLPEYGVYRYRLEGNHRAAVIDSLKRLVPAADVSGRGICITSDEGRISVSPLKRREGFEVFAFSRDTEVSKELCTDMCEIIKSIDKP